MNHSTSPELNMNNKAVALMSGGLDSALAVQLVKRQGVQVTAVHFTSFFSTLDPNDEESPVRVLARQLEVPLVLRPKGTDFLNLIRNPKYGYGKNLNPCIDCRIYTFVKAKALMKEIGASFLITGEVVGQRPMSQRKETIRLIEKRAGCDGIVVRPLSALVLPPTLPEQAGIVDREQLLNVAGRGRKVQLQMAEDLGLRGYSPPAGGCLLTEEVFSRRLNDLLQDTDHVTTEELELLRIGRHIRLRPGLKVVVGRREAENYRLEHFRDAGVLFLPVGFPGPSVLALGRPEPDEELLIAGILRRYTKQSSRGRDIAVREPHGRERHLTLNTIADDQFIVEHMI